MKENKTTIEIWFASDEAKNLRYDFSGMEIVCDDDDRVVVETFCDVKSLCFEQSKIDGVVVDWEIVCVEALSIQYD